MTKYIPTIRLAKEPYDIIKWFTLNWDNEVGALGIGEMRDGELCVDKLVFPKQIVNGAHVHFKPEDWGPIIMELSEEEISKIIFYWHRHPGTSATPSAGDEKDTFDVFMDENSGRDFFGFLITAKSGNDMNYHARIDMRTPVWATLENAEIITDADDTLREKCEKIIEEKITVGNAGPSDQPGMLEKKEEFQGTLVQPVRANQYDPDQYNFNDFVFTVARKNGQLVIEASDYFDQWIGDAIETELSEHIRHSRTDFNGSGTITYTIQPKKKRIKQLYQHFKSMEDEMCLVPDDWKDEERAIGSRDIDYADRNYGWGRY